MSLLSQYCAGESRWVSHGELFPDRNRENGHGHRPHRWTLFRHILRKRKYTGKTANQDNTTELMMMKHAGVRGEREALALACTLDAFRGLRTMPQTIVRCDGLYFIRAKTPAPVVYAVLHV